MNAYEKIVVIGACTAVLFFIYESAIWLSKSSIESDEHEKESIG